MSQLHTARLLATHNCTCTLTSSKGLVGPMPLEPPHIFLRNELWLLMIEGTDTASNGQTGPMRAPSQPCVTAFVLSL